MFFILRCVRTFALVAAVGALVVIGGMTGVSAETVNPDAPKHASKHMSKHATPSAAKGDDSYTPKAQ